MKASVITKLLWIIGTGFSEYLLFNAYSSYTEISSSEILFFGALTLCWFGDRRHLPRKKSYAIYIQVFFS